jgi:hypothetical protein
MSSKLSELLSGDIETLFTNGACHIFARALTAQFPQYVLRCVRMQQWASSIGTPLAKFGGPRLLHVYAYHADVMIDVRGTGNEGQWFEAYLAKNNFNPECFRPVFRCCTLNSLFRPSNHHADINGPKSCDALFLDPEFVSSAMEIAKAHIRANFAKYAAL